MKLPNLMNDFSSWFARGIAVVAVVHAAWFATAQEYKTISAQGAIDQIRGEFGASSVNWLVEMKATGGQPQPLQWEVIALDPTAPGLLRRFVSYFGAVLDDGPEGRRYPGDPPRGFFGVNNLGVDSVAAFTIAEAEARKARMGFDSCDYHLQAREFSNETIWRLELVDGSHRMVGSIFISGTNGAVLRTVWVRRDPVSGYPSITDSLIPGVSPGPVEGLTEIVPGRRPFDPQLMPEMNTRPGTVESSPITGVPPTGSMTQVDPTGNPAPGGQAPQSFSRPVTGSGGSIFRRNHSPPSQSGPTQPQPPAVIMQPAGPPLPPDLAMPSPPDPAPSAPSMEPDLAPLPDPEPITGTPPSNPNSAPPITVPSGEGSSERIPPPPVPQ